MKLDDFNMHLIRVIGILIASLNIQFFGAFYYSTDDDKRHLLFGRLLVSVPRDFMISVSLHVQ